MTERLSYNENNRRRNILESDRVGRPDVKRQSVLSPKMRGNELKFLLEMGGPTTIKDSQLSKKPGQINASEIQTVRSSQQLSKTFNHSRKYCPETRVAAKLTKELLR